MLNLGAVFLLVQFLDFAPRHRDLAVRLAQRFVHSRASQAFGALDLTRLAMRESYLDSFYAWLVSRVHPEGVCRSRRRGPSPSASEMRLLSLLDQYRSGRALRRVTEGRSSRVRQYRDDHRACPLEHAAYSPEA